MTAPLLRSLFRAGRHLPKLSPKGRAATLLLRSADRARDAGRFEAAAVLYEQVATLLPRRAGVHIQAGHMFKEAGDLAAAERHYQCALELTPDDAELALQMGHFYKVARRKPEAERAYRRAAELRPGWGEPVRELEGLNSAIADPASSGLGDIRIEDLARELVPTATSLHMDDRPQHMLRVTRLGVKRERSRWGVMTALHGIEAIRGFCLSASPVVEVRILMDGQLIHGSPPVASDAIDPPSGKYAFNAWVDFTHCPRGRSEIEIRCVCADGALLSHRQHVLIAAPLTGSAARDSDGVVLLADDMPGSIEQRINALPSMVRPARRNVFPDGVRNVLVQRTDQLGDMVSSIPAIRRLRELLPQAHLVGLLTEANADLARTLGLFDEIITVDFPDDWDQRKRIMSFSDQEALKERLGRYAFDLAIDLAESSISRPLLLLSGARFLYGFHDNEWPWLNAGYVANVHDPMNHAEIDPPSSKVLGMIERLGTLLDSGAKIVRRQDLDRAVLEKFGIGPGTRYIILHNGARIAFSRWPHYIELAELLVAETDCRIVLLSENAVDRASLPPALQDEARFMCLAGRLPFDEFDALLSFADLFVGNDSGPKHLASLRGTPVVSIHSARVNWNEWGQELTGTIISRKVPCAGCAIFHDADECAKDFACIRQIGVPEVFTAARVLLGANG